MAVNSDPIKSFLENSCDLVRKHGLKIGAALLLTGNLFMISQPLWDWEHANLMRDWVACPILSVFNIQLMRDQKESSYDFATIGSPFHVIANAMDGNPRNAVTWGVFNAMALMNSQWGKKISTGVHRLTGFIQNKKDMMLADPHVLAATSRLALSGFQFEEACRIEHPKMRVPLQILSGAGIAGSLFYMGSAVLNHLSNRKTQPQMD